MRIVSINLGKKKPIKIAQKTIQTGIYKRATNNEVMIGKQGLFGDTVVDQERHGGPDQAVYLYFTKDYLWWSHEL